MEKITDFFINIKKKIRFIWFKSDFYDLNQIFLIFFTFPWDNSVINFLNGLTSPQNIVIRGKNMYTIHFTALSVILGDQSFLELIMKVSAKSSPRIFTVTFLKTLALKMHRPGRGGPRWIQINISAICQWFLQFIKFLFAKKIPFFSCLILISDFFIKIKWF